MSGIEIFPMTEENYKTVAAVAKDNLAEAWSEETYFRQLSNPNDYTYLAYLDGEPAGFLSLWYIAGEVEINNIAVSEKFRRKGIAKALFSAAHNDIPNGSSWFLEVRQSNTAAISLYEKMGFEQAGIRKNFYSEPTENALIMVKKYQEE